MMDTVPMYTGAVDFNKVEKKTENNSFIEFSDDDLACGPACSHPCIIPHVLS